ncbi:hypothetical protein CBW65_13865 [Tumebacillus avium]|uniref:Uncharacterized protein n=1 Tax=Tumebacillus avium TaxID=1903704 RepID=A0A1Y0IPL5_9BACL|nr:hypothetical protein [Tumebacillus avium]ARU61969.1 hypothetical protein CBW65_13865 [Tumebacillus avium]
MAGKRLSDFNRKNGDSLIEIPLYTKIKVDTSVETDEYAEILDYDENGVPDILYHIDFIENKDIRYLKKIILEERTFYYFCPFCKKETHIIYKGHELKEKYIDPKLATYSYSYSMSEEYDLYVETANKDNALRLAEFTEQVFEDNRVFQMNLECTSKEKHTMYLVFHLTSDNFLMKTGQYPSIYDFDNSLVEYKKILKDKNITKELTSATRLISHDMAVGAFLYLRRIFENLLFEQSERAKLDNKIDAEVYSGADTKRRVEMLHIIGYVPAYLDEINPFLYDILSKGVHKLSEEECKQYYDTLRKAILLILDEKVAMEQKGKLKKTTKKELNKIHTNISK